MNFTPAAFKSSAPQNHNSLWQSGTFRWEACKKRPLTLFSTNSSEDSSDKLTDSPPLSKKLKLGHANLETPISFTPPSPKIATEFNQLESPHDVNVISTSTPSVIHADSSMTNEANSSLNAKVCLHFSALLLVVIYELIFNHSECYYFNISSNKKSTVSFIFMHWISNAKSISDALNSKSIVHPLPCMIPSAMTTTRHMDTSPSALSPNECKPRPPSNAPPTIPASDNAAPRPTPSVSTTSVKCMRPGPNKNGR